MPQKRSTTLGSWREWNAVAAALLAVGTAAHAAPAQTLVRLPMERSALAESAPLLGRVPSAQPIHLDFSLPLRDPAGLNDFLARVQDPHDPRYKHFLSPAQFAQEFGPSQSDYDAVAEFARSQGLNVTRFTGRTLLSADGTVDQVGRALGVTFSRYARPDGTEFYAADRGPLVPSTLAARGITVLGLDDALRPIPNLQSAPPRPEGHGLQPFGYFDSYPGSGPNGGLAPSDILSYYGGVDVSNLNGGGETVALFELDGYNINDVNQYKNQFGVGGNTSVETVSVGGVSFPPKNNDGGQTECTLDIDMVLIFAPQVSHILVYEGNDFIKEETQIANDDRASVVSFSWTTDGGESARNLDFYQSENNVFAQMAAEGMSVFAASGDTGAYNDTGGHVPGTQVAVEDPASQPWVTGVGGTKINSYHDFFKGWQFTDETVWSSGGGGVSQIWPLPAYQSVLFPSGDTQISAAMRNVPDVSANAGTPYAVYKDGGWTLVSGTSASAPLWAGYTARTNQWADGNGQARVGCLNSLLYSVYPDNFLYAAPAALRDITKGDNGVFDAFSGYDNATGLGVMAPGFVTAPLGSPVATVTALSAPATAQYGQTVTLKATVSPFDPVGSIGGSVTFSDADGGVLGTVPVSNGQATLTLGTLPTGLHTLSAQYSGGYPFTGSFSPGSTLLVSNSSIVPGLTINPPTETAGQPFLATATLLPESPSTLPPAGTVTFTVNGVSVGQVAVVNGTARMTLTEPVAGDYTVSGAYSGDGGYQPASLPGVMVHVAAIPTTTTLGVSAASLLTGQPETLTATVTGYGTPTGSVAFTDGGTALGTAALSGGAARLTVSFTTPGAHTVRAAYGGDGANTPSSGTAGVTVGLSTAIAADVSLQGVRAGNLAQPLVCTLTPTGATAGTVTTQTVTPDAATGAFTLSGVPAGTYTLGVKGAKWLRHDVAIDTTGGSVSGLSVSLLGGDVNGDNQVSLQDLGALRRAYGSTPKSPNWDPAADLNCDGQVSLQDLGILRSNYGKVGDK